MNQRQLLFRVRSITRDLNNSIFRQIDVTDFINEAIDRVKQVIPNMANMDWLYAPEDEVTYMPAAYQHLFALYSASRCYFQDDRHYQAANMMNEFEVKLAELRDKIESGDIIVLDPDGNPVIIGPRDEYVIDNYYYANRYSKTINNTTKYNFDDPDDGVEGV
jgi:hypothetical protein